MTLIDHFKNFVEVSLGQGLSANSRSLYFAILSEFNKARFPSRMVLPKNYLQYLSGITSSHSFDAARKTLLQVGAVQVFDNQVYALTTGEALKMQLNGNFRGKNFARAGNAGGNFAESPLGLLTIPKNKDGDKDADADAAKTATTAAGGKLSVNSEAVKRAWLLWNGEELKGGNAFAFIELENRYGTEKLVAAITEAGKSDKNGRLNYNYVASVLKRMNGETKPKVENVGDYGGEDILEAAQ